MDATQPQFNSNSGSTPKCNPNGKSNMDLGKPGNSKKPPLDYKNRISVTLPEFDRLQEEENYYASMYLILPEYQSEQIYASLLSRLLTFKQTLSEKIALWREHVRLIEMITEELCRFHMPEVHDKLVPCLFEDI